MKEGEPKGFEDDQQSANDGQEPKEGTTGNEQKIETEETGKMEQWEIDSFLEKSIEAYREQVRSCEEHVIKADLDIAEAEKLRDGVKNNPKLLEYADRVVKDWKELRRNFIDDKNRALFMIEQYQEALDERQKLYEQIAEKTNQGSDN